MNKVFDNGELLLGTKFNIETYCKEKMSHFLQICDNYVAETFQEILEEISDFEDTDILAVNYESGMGMSIDCWGRNDVVWSEL